MPIPANVAMRFDEADKAALVELAGIMKMTQTETVRTLVREKLADLTGSITTEFNPPIQEPSYDQAN